MPDAEPGRPAPQFMAQRTVAQDAEADVRDGPVHGAGDVQEQIEALDRDQAPDRADVKAARLVGSWRTGGREATTVADHPDVRLPESIAAHEPPLPLLGD